MSIVKDSAIVAIDGSVVVVIIVAAGALMTRIGALDKAASEGLSKLTLNLLLPALLFTQMIKSLDIGKVDKFGILLFFCTLHILLGCLVGWVLSKITSASQNMTRLIMTCIAFQDTTAVPLIFAEVLGNGDVTKDDPTFKEDAISYVLIYTVFVTVYKWTVAYGMLKSPGPVDMLPYSTEVPFKQGCFWTFKKIMNPPIYATLVSIPLALIPYMKEYVFTGSGAVLNHNLFSALVTIGSTASPLICVLLGSKLSHGYPSSADISKLHIAIILFGKEVIMPMIGLGFVMLFYHYSYIDRILAVMLLIIFAGPTSLQLLMICTAHNNHVDNISKLYMIMYLTAVVPMAGWTMGFLVMYY